MVPDRHAVFAHAVEACTEVSAIQAATVEGRFDGYRVPFFMARARSDARQEIDVAWLWFHRVRELPKGHLRQEHRVGGWASPTLQLNGLIGIGLAVFLRRTNRLSRATAVVLGIVAVLLFVLGREEADQ